MTDEKTVVIFIRADALLHDRVKRFADSKSGTGPQWTMSDAARYLMTRSLDELERRR